ncbi:MAG: hypothetical protein P8L46_01615 [Acidimicrobiales bacterium]|nr:hypothetical protein [Acidimicrobiales bacterium]MDG2216723.1 hypothetical protein [Acidimicrobiales bacterium]
MSIVSLCDGVSQRRLGAIQFGLGVVEFRLAVCQVGYKAHDMGNSDSLGAPSVSFETFCCGADYGFATSCYWHQLGRSTLLDALTALELKIDMSHETSGNELWVY